MKLPVDPNEMEGSRTPEYVVVTDVKFSYVDHSKSPYVRMLWEWVDDRGKQVRDEPNTAGVIFLGEDGNASQSYRRWFETLWESGLPRDDIKRLKEVEQLGDPGDPEVRRKAGNIVADVLVGKAFESDVEDIGDYSTRVLTRHLPDVETPRIQRATDATDLEDFDEEDDLPFDPYEAVIEYMKRHSPVKPKTMRGDLKAAGFSTTEIREALSELREEGRIQKNRDEGTYEFY